MKLQNKEVLTTVIGKRLPVSYCDGWNIDTGSILNELIKEAAKCTQRSGDVVYYNWMTVQDIIDGREKPGDYDILFGFYDLGVDPGFMINAQKEYRRILKVMVRYEDLTDTLILKLIEMEKI